MVAKVDYANTNDLFAFKIGWKSKLIFSKGKGRLRKKEKDFS